MFCNSHVLGHSFLHSLIRQTRARSHTYHHAQAERQLRLLMEQNKYGFPRLETWGKPAEFYCEQGQKCLYHRAISLSAFLIMSDLASQCYLEQISSIFIQLRYFFLHLPPVYRFTDFYSALFDWVSLGVDDAMLFQWTEQSVDSDIPEKLFPNGTLVPYRSSFIM